MCEMDLQLTVKFWILVIGTEFLDAQKYSFKLIALFIFFLAIVIEASRRLLLMIMNDAMRVTSKLGFYAAVGFYLKLALSWLHSFLWGGLKLVEVPHIFLLLRIGFE